MAIIMDIMATGVLEPGKDARVDVFRPEWFEGRKCLDIGCNAGLMTLLIGMFAHEYDSLKLFICVSRGPVLSGYDFVLISAQFCCVSVVAAYFCLFVCLSLPF